MALHIHPIVTYAHSLGAQSCPLLLPGDSTGGQADSTPGTENAMPGQRAVIG